MELLLKKRFTFTEADVRKNILVPFRVERDYVRLAIRLRYGPKSIRDPEIILPKIQACVETYFPDGFRLTEEDMKDFDQLLNFVTLSLDKDGEYVGCAHRHPPEQTILISEEGSDWGFAPAPAGRGDWRIVLHVQAVVVGAVDYDLEVYGLEREESGDALPAL
ncbi:MAG: hypothetical protein HFG02_07235 [Oscillibacter sp.]|nr:hypothetical protein [Oscillibacter sp.]